MSKDITGPVDKVTNVMVDLGPRTIMAGNEVLATSDNISIHVRCHSCDDVFPDYAELAVHIMATKKGHRKGRRWAAKYLMHRSMLDKKRLNRGSSLTKADKDSRESTRRELSGQQSNELTICPKCFKGRRLMLPIEYTKSPTVWKIKGVLVMLCSICE